MNLNNRWKSYTASLLARAFYKSLPYENRTEAQWKHAVGLTNRIMTGEGMFEIGKDRGNSEFVSSREATFLGEPCLIKHKDVQRILLSLHDFGMMLAGLNEGLSFEYYIEPDAESKRLCEAAALLFKIN